MKKQLTKQFGYSVLWLALLCFSLPAGAANKDATSKQVLPQKSVYTKEVRSLVKLGKRGGDLSPVSKKFNNVDNKTFKGAMQAWNNHDWKGGVRKFRTHIKNHPSSPWAGESELHIGCFYRYTNQLAEAKQQFSKIISKYPNTDVAHKAKKRLAGSYYLEGNYTKAREIYKELSTEPGVSWRHRTYARHWQRHLNRITRIKTKPQALNQCGIKSLALVYDQVGLPDRFSAMERLAAGSTEEATFGQLQDLIQPDFPDAGVIQTDLPGLRRQKLPVIASVEPHHFVVVSKIEQDYIHIRDPYNGESRQSISEFLQKWNGAILSPESEDIALESLAQGNDLLKISGGCCGNPVPEPDLGENDDQPEEIEECGSGKGSPLYSINMVNLNMKVKDIPLYYTPGKGLPVEITMTFNSGDAAPPSYFGNKWSFNYDTHYILNPDNNILIIRPDGRRDLYTRNPDNSFTPPPGIYDTLIDDGAGEYTLRLKKSKLLYHYNTDQNLAYIEDRWSNRLVFFYDTNGWLDYMTDASGQTTDFQLDASGRIIKVIEPAGRFASFSYDINGNLATVTDMAGYASSYTYMVNTETSDNVSLAGSYDITAITTTRGTTSFKYIYPDNSGYLSYPPSPTQSGENFHIIVTNPEGEIIEYFWDGYYTMSRVTRGIQEVSDTSHTDGFIDYDERQAGISKLYYSDVDGRVTGVYKEADNAYGAFATKTRDTETYIRTALYSYTGNNLASTTDAHGNSQSFAYDLRGNVTSLQDYLNKTTNLEYDANDNLVTITDPLNRIIRLEYGPNHNVTKRLFDRPIEADIGTTITYTPFGKVKTMTNAKAKVTTYNYTVNGYLESIVGQSSYPFTFTQDTKGRIQSIKDSVATVLESYTYDDLDRLTRIDYPDTTFMSRSYACCSLDTVTDRGGRMTTYGRDGMGRRISTTDSEGGVTRYTYDALGRLTSVIDPENRTTAWTRNPLGWITTETKEDGAATTYGYDALGRVTQKQDAKGQITTYAYDANSRLTTINYPDSSTVTATYYDDGQIATVTDTRGTTTYSYDDLGRLTTIDGPDINDTQTYGYDELFNLTSLTVADYGTVNYTHDYNLNRLNQLTLPGGGLINYTYHANTLSNLETVSLPNNLTSEYRYDTQHRLTDILNKTVTGTVFASEQYQYTMAQNLNKITQLDSRSTDYVYDKLDRLKTETANDTAGIPIQNKTFTYDGVGNRTGQSLNSTAKTLVYNGRNQLIRAGPTPTVSTRPVTLTGTVSDTYSPVKSLTLAGNPVTLNPDGSYAVDVTLNLGENVFTLQAEDEAGNLKTIQHQLFYGVDDITWSFDANGNLQRKEDTVNNIIETYTYDVRNRLSGYNKTINGTSTTTATYAYDPFGRRINKTVDGVETRYIYDINGTLLAETTADGTVTRKYIWAGLTPVAQIDIQGTTETVTYLHTDQLATARLGTDQTGTVVWHWDRDAFGTGAANDDPDGNSQATVVNLRFPGQYYDSETGLHYNYFRYYDPKTGRYITADPLGLIEGEDLNLYRYVENNPVNFIDPFGLYRITPTGGQPPDTTTHNAMLCFDNCAGREVTVTGATEGGHSPGSAHETGQACDVGTNSNPWLDRETAERCFSECFNPSGSYGQQEHNHYHFQTRPGQNGSTGFAPGIR